MVLLPNIFDDFTKEWEGGAIQSPVTLKVYFHFMVEVVHSIVVVLESLKPQKVTTLERMRQN